MENLVHCKVKTGLYGFASEVIREGLRLLDQRDQMRGLHKEEIRKPIDLARPRCRRAKARTARRFSPPWMLSWPNLSSKGISGAALHAIAEGASGPR